MLRAGGGVTIAIAITITITISSTITPVIPKRCTLLPRTRRRWSVSIIPRARVGRRHRRSIRASASQAWSRAGSLRVVRSLRRAHGGHARIVAGLVGRCGGGVAVGRGRTERVAVVRCGRTTARLLRAGIARGSHATTQSPRQPSFHGASTLDVDEDSPPVDALAIRVFERLGQILRVFELDERVSARALQLVLHQGDILDRTVVAELRFEIVRGHGVGQARDEESLVGVLRECGRRILLRVGVAI